MAPLRPTILHIILVCALQSTFLLCVFQGPFCLPPSIPPTPPSPSCVLTAPGQCCTLCALGTKHGSAPLQVRHPHFLSGALHASQDFTEGGDLFQLSWGWCLTPRGMWNAHTP